MHICKLRLANYKSFEDSGWLSLSRNFTVVIGKNNVGKTALLEAFKLSRIQSRPHRSRDVASDALLNPRSIVQVEMTVTGKELKNALLSGGAAWVPTPPQVSAAEREAFALSLLERSNISIEMETSQNEGFAPTRYPSHALFKREPNSTAIQLNPSTDKKSIAVSGAGSGDADQLPEIIQRTFASKIYVFRAERLNIGRISAREAPLLEPDGSNLAATLMYMQSNPTRFDRFNAHVSEIFPSIQRVTIVPVNQEFEVRIWSVEVKSEREDLAIPLQESGTGLGQVLAILYVAMTVQSGVIVIDEPNTFLHPGAAKKLIQILRQYDTHQYVLATHSGDLIATADPDVIHLVTWANGRSNIEQIDRRRVDDLRRVLIEIGASFSDVFGFDRAVWVEGPTEEACFPMILRRLKGSTPLGVIFIAVKHTGDFERKGNQKRLIWDLYERLSSGFTLLPSTVSFSFDRESRTEQQICDLERESRGRVHFLPRLTYENYLIHADAIAAVLTAILHESQTPVTAERVEAWIKENGQQFARGNWSGDLDDVEWLAKVHSPSLLSALFDAVSGVNLEYSKTTHSVLLTEWLLDHKPAALAELAEYISGLSPL